MAKAWSKASGEALAFWKATRALKALSSRKWDSPTMT